MNLIGDHIILRALEPEDVDYLYRTENDPDFALFGDQHPPYSRFLLRNYIEQAHQSIYTAQQLRLVIHHKVADRAIGLIDLYDFDVRNMRVALGIVITEPSFRGQGIGRDAVGLILKYTFDVLDCRQVYTLIAPDNQSSIALFSSSGFEQTSVLKSWWQSENGLFQDMLIFQKFKDKS